MRETNLTVTFVASEELEDEDVVEINEAIRLSLDSEANDNETSFVTGTPAYIKQFPPGEFTMEVNIGTVEKRLRNVPYTITEELVYFANVTIANLNYLPNGEVTYSWVGKDLGNPVFNGRVATIQESGVGVLSCTYITLYDQLMILYAGEEATTILLVVTNGTASDSLLITYTGAVDVTERPVVITVKDYCSNEIVVGAYIEVTAPGYPTTNFITDALGQANLGILVVGITYNIKIIATGYRDSDLDSLSNDSFVVTEES
jgi:hypothetical protein